MATLGEKIVRTDFNINGHPEVDHIKKTGAELINYVKEHGKDIRLTIIAIAQIETAVEKSVTATTTERWP